MKTSLEEISPVKKKLSIEIESKEVDKKLNKAYRELGKKAKIAGFRPGKIPRNILEIRFSAQVGEDVTRDLISETLPLAMQEVEIFPLGTPLLEKDLLKEGQNFKYSAVMEVRPEFMVKDYLKIEVEKEKLSISEEDVRKQLEQIREANGKLTTIDQDRPVKKDDYVVIDYEGFEQGKSLDGIKSKNFLMKVGSHEFHPGFDEALIGLHKGDETEIRVDFEKDHYHLKLAGRKVDFKVKVTEIKEMVLSELNDDFARNLGADFEELEDLKSKVRESLIANEEKRIDKDLKKRILEKISANVDFELPQTLIESELDYAVESVKQNLMRSGSSLEKAGLSEEKLREEFKPTAKNRVKELLILGEIAKQDNIELSEEDLTDSYKNIAENIGQDIETVRKYYEAKNLVGSLKEKLLEEKTLNYIVENAKILEVDKIT
jgi:trigger factor